LTRWWLPEKQYLFPGVIQGKTKHHFRKEYTWKCIISRGQVGFTYARERSLNIALLRGVH